MSRVHSTYDYTISRVERNTRRVRLFFEDNEVYVSIIDMMAFQETNEFNFLIKDFIWFVNKVCHYGSTYGQIKGKNTELFYEVDNALHNNVIVFAQSKGKQRLISFSIREMEQLNYRKAEISKYSHWLKKAISTEDVKLTARHIRKDIQQIDEEFNLSEEPKYFDICC